MHIEFTEEQKMLRDSAEKYLRDNYGFDQRQATVRGGQGFSTDRWQAFAELGWLAMMLPEEFDGLGGGALEASILCEALGRHLVVEPYLESAILVGKTIGDSGSISLKKKYLASLAEGRLQGALAILETGTQSSFRHVKTHAVSCDAGYKLTGFKCLVSNGAAADVLLVSARTNGEWDDVEGISLFAVDSNAAGITRTSYTSYDGRHACDLQLDGVIVSEDELVGKAGGAFQLLEGVRDWGLLAISAEIIGAMDALLQATMIYTQQRKQFGQPISQFQVLRHRMANMFMELELTRSLVMAAAIKLDEGSDEAPAYLAAAKAKAGKAGRFVAQSAIQLHGGIGMTDELNVGHYFKRITILDQAFNAAPAHLERYIKIKV